MFRVFAGSSRFFFADLLAHLADDPFGHPGEIATRKRVQESISAFIDRAGRATILELLDGPESKAAPVQSHVAAYTRLIETG